MTVTLTANLGGSGHNPLSHKDLRLYIIVRQAPQRKLWRQAPSLPPLPLVALTSAFSASIQWLYHTPLSLRFCFTTCDEACTTCPPAR